MVSGIANWSNSHSDMLRIDTIILCVGSDESDVQCPVSVICMDDKSVLVTTDIEKHPVSLQKTRIAVSAFYLLRAVPVGL